MAGSPDSDTDINRRMPIIPHESLGADCCGCFVVHLDGDRADVVCNECQLVIRSGSVKDIEAALLQLAQTDVICSAVCTHCAALNTFPGLSTVEAFICSECGQGVEVVAPLQ